LDDDNEQAVAITLDHLNCPPSKLSPTCGREPSHLHN
jgi:hypothetical protein